MRTDKERLCLKVSVLYSSVRWARQWWWGREWVTGFCFQLKGGFSLSWSGYGWTLVLKALSGSWPKSRMNNPSHSPDNMRPVSFLISGRLAAGAIDCGILQLRCGKLHDCIFCFLILYSVNTPVTANIIMEHQNTVQHFCVACGRQLTGDWRPLTAVVSCFVPFKDTCLSLCHLITRPVTLKDTWVFASHCGLFTKHLK